MKNNLKIGIALVIAPFLLAISSLQEKSPNYEKKADKLTEQVAKKLEKEKKLILIGIGGRMMDDIQSMHMGFNFYQQVDLQTARELMVYATKEYLSAINSSTELRPYLHEYPFTAKNVEIRIWICNPDRTYPPLDKIYYISTINGTLNYYLDRPETCSRIELHTETYEEALKATAQVNSGPTFEQLQQGKHV